MTTPYDKLLEIQQDDLNYHQKRIKEISSNLEEIKSWSSQKIKRYNEIKSMHFKNDYYLPDYNTRVDKTDTLYYIMPFDQADLYMNGVIDDIKLRVLMKDRVKTMSFREVCE